MSKNNQQLVKCKNCTTNLAENLDESNSDSSEKQNNKNIENESLNQNNDLKINDNLNGVSNLNKILSSRNNCIIDRLSYLCLSEQLADVYFSVGSDLVHNSLGEQAKNVTLPERIPAHKLVLSIGSQVFMAMFYGTGSQMAQPSDNLINLPDVEPEPFKHMLRYLYTDELYVEPDSVMSTLYVAKKYAVNALEKECVDFLKVNLKADNAFMLLQQARLFDEWQLTDLCLELIDKHSIEAFQSDCFLDIDLETLILILKRDTLGIREAKLYFFVLKWAQHQCSKLNHMPINRENQQLVLGDAIKHIRFPLMSKEEFAMAMNDNESRIIDNESIVDLFINLTLINSSANSIMNNQSFLTKKLNYNDTPRCCLGGKEQMINRFCQVESRWGYSGTSDRVRFSVNRRIYVVGFGLYGSIYGKYEYQVFIQLIHYDSCTTCAQNATAFTCDGSNTTFRVLFKEPIEITPDVDYIAAATLKGPDSFYGTKGLRKVSHDSGGKVTFQFQYASGNNNGTSVEDGQIPEIIFLYSV